jgi:hypothetical protein
MTKTTDIYTSVSDGYDWNYRLLVAHHGLTEKLRTNVWTGRMTHWYCTSTLRKPAVGYKCQALCWQENSAHLYKCSQSRPLLLLFRVSKDMVWRSRTGAHPMERPVTPTQSKFRKYRRCPRCSESGGQSEAPPPPNINTKSTDIIETQIWSILHDLPCSRSQPFKLADD